MSTFTFRVTSSATPPNLVGFGQQPDNGAPSYLDMIVTNSSDPVIVNGTYDAYCLDPSSLINVRGQAYNADAFRGDVLSSYQAIGLTSLTQAKVDQISWILAQNFTSDPKFNGQFNYGEVQLAIWEIAGFPGDGSHVAGSDPRYINDNNRNVVNPADVTFLVTASANAVANGDAGGPSDAFFSAVIDPEGLIQPLIVQLQKAKLGNFVWFDEDIDGIQDNNETGIDNVVVKLYDNNGVLLATTTTGDDYSTAAVEKGWYQFTGLKAGNYQVKFFAPSDMVFTTSDVGSDETDSDANQTTGLSSIVALAAGESNQTIDAGLYKLASLGDYVWVDGNNDGQQNDGAASGLNGVTVNLYKGDGSFVATTTTADDSGGNPGYYKFVDLIPGDYKVEFIKPAGYVFAKQNIDADISDSDADTTTGMTAVTTLLPGENDLTWDAGLVQELASLGDYVWVDDNNDGQQNDGAASGLNGVTVNLYKGDGSFVATTTTANDTNGNAGYYAFKDLIPGDYKVEFIKPAGYNFAQQNVGADTSDSDADTTTGMTAVTTLTPGENDLSWDAGLLQKLACLGDYVWEDCNNDGQQNDGSSNGVNGVTVNLYSGDGTFVATTTTANDSNGKPGYYKFNDLNPGEYKVEFIKPSGYAFTRQDVGSNNSDSDADTGTGMTVVTTLVAGENDRSWDAGLIKLASLGDYVWEDCNNDGRQNDGSASGMNGVTVNLLKPDGTVIATTTTANDSNGKPGYYKFVDLTPGDYKIQFVKPAGYEFAKQDVGSNNSDSDANATTGMTAVTTLVSGENDLSQDAGLVKLKLASIGDFVWEDMNMNGIQDSGEKGIANVTVKLLNSAGTVLETTKTNSSGKYLFDDLNPGDYKIQVVAPSGYYVTKQNQGSNDSNDSDIDANTGITALTNLVSGENDLKWDAGLYRKASVGDKVWDDMDHDNVQDLSEPGIGGITVKLMTTAGVVLATTKTDSKGNYLFDNLDPGTYVLQFDKGGVQYFQYNKWNNMSNWKWAVKDKGTNDSIDSDVAGNAVATTNVSKTDSFNLVSGQNDMTRDAGITPLVIDLNGDGVQTVSRADAGGKFDLFGNGNAIASGWISGDDGFLAVDSNGNGRIDDISELFGGHTKGDGFAKLVAFDSNHDGFVNANDDNFSSLLIWKDGNGNHQTDDGELLSLIDAGVASLKASYEELPFLDAQGNVHLERSNAILADGSSVDMTDVYFNVDIADATAAGLELTGVNTLTGYDMYMAA